MRQSLTVELLIVQRKMNITKDNVSELIKKNGVKKKL